jgi:hypothetical protein
MNAAGKASMKYIAVLTASTLIVADGCGLFKKSPEESEGYKELMKYQEQTEKQRDSIKRAEYQKVLDSSTRDMMRQIDSLKHHSDSVEKSIENRINKLNK